MLYKLNLKQKQIMKTFIVADIDYDTDGELVDDLPTEMIVEIEEDEGEILEDWEVDDLICDEISNRTGFLVFGFTKTPQ